MTAEDEKKQEIEKLLSEIYQKEVNIDSIEQKQDCWIASEVKTERRSYTDNSKKSTKGGYESFADVYIISVKGGELAKDVILLKQHSYEMQQNDWNGDPYYEEQPTTELRVYNSKQKLVAYMEDGRYRDLSKENGFDLMSDGVGHPLFFAKKFLNSLQSEAGPSSAILRETEHLSKIGRYDESVLRDLREQERIRDLIRNGDEIERKKREKENRMHRQMDEAMERIEQRRQTRQEKLESKKLLKVVKEFVKTGIDIDSRIQIAVEMKKIERENEK